MAFEPAETIRAHVLELIEDQRDRDVHVRLQRSWCESSTLICFIYRSTFGAGMLGLRIEIDPEVANEDNASDIVYGDMGEPLGALDATLSPPDEAGIRWWRGDPPEIRTHSRVDARGQPKG